MRLISSRLGDETVLAPRLAAHLFRRARTAWTIASSLGKSRSFCATTSPSTLTMNLPGAPTAISAETPSAFSISAAARTALGL